MGKMKIQSRLVTPMFCCGADGKTPELRSPSLKGALRFWWRAIHPNLSLEDLKKEETNIFGGAGDNDAKKSNFSIRISNIEPKFGKYQPLPHRINSSRFVKDAFMPNTTFDIIINEENEEIKNLLILISILGSIGTRSRRGFGCFQIETIQDEKYNFDLKEDIPNLIKLINPEFEIGLKYNRNYPYLQKIEIGKAIKSYDELLKNIGKASHDFDTPYTGTTNKYFAKNARYASPIFVSIYKQNKEYYPIISSLKRTINDVNNHQTEEEKKNSFIKAILGGK